MSEEYKRFTVSLPQDLYEEFEKYRKKLNISRSDAVRKAMYSYMSSQENLSKISSNVIGCISLIMGYKHFIEDSSHDDNDDEQNHKKSLDHEHDYSSRPIYANVHQTDLILNNEIQHHFTDVIISKMHIHLQFEKCLEIIAVSGPFDRVEKLKENLEQLKSVLSIGFFIIDKVDEEKRK
ncbi:MAG: CopG family ribbon-helix-helix protein [Candidatus Lokiarchaeota archaeon]|nr:CopG family ribbon-helix-helix protein [Candidatus Lokiarchaeota archaeon]